MTKSKPKNPKDIRGQPLNDKTLYFLNEVGVEYIAFAYCDFKDGQVEIAHEFFSSGRARALHPEEIDSKYFKRYEPLCSLERRRGKKAVALYLGVERMAKWLKIISQNHLGKANAEKLERLLETEEIVEASRH